MPFFSQAQYKKCLNKQSINGQKRYGSKLSSTEMANGRTDRDFYLLPIFLTLNNFVPLSASMPAEFLRPCQKKLRAVVVTCCLFSFYWFLSPFLPLHYNIFKARNHVDLCESVKLQHLQLRHFRHYTSVGRCRLYRIRI